MARRRTFGRQLPACTACHRIHLHVSLNMPAPCVGRCAATLDELRTIEDHLTQLDQQMARGQLRHALIPLTKNETLREAVVDVVQI